MQLLVSRLALLHGLHTVADQLVQLASAAGHLLCPAHDGKWCLLCLWYAAHSGRGFAWPFWPACYDCVSSSTFHTRLLGSEVPSCQLALHAAICLQGKATM